MGAANPFATNLVGASINAGVASLLGQLSGNLSAGKSITESCNYDLNAVLGASAGGAIGGSVSRVVIPYFPIIRYRVIGSQIGKSGISRAPGETVGGAILLRCGTLRPPLKLAMAMVVYLAFAMYLSVSLFVDYVVATHEGDAEKGQSFLLLCMVLAILSMAPGLLSFKKRYLKNLKDKGFFK